MLRFCNDLEFFGISPGIPIDFTGGKTPWLLGSYWAEGFHAQKSIPLYLRFRPRFGGLRNRRCSPTSRRVDATGDIHRSRSHRRQILPIRRTTETRAGVFQSRGLWVSREAL